MLKPSFLAALVATGFACTLSSWAADRPTLTTAVIQTNGSVVADRTSYDGVVEAVRQSTLSAQVPGAIVGLNVKAGDQVRAGQELVRIDAHAATQNAIASAAQVDAARANLNVASKEYERQKQLFQKQYISQGALDRVQAQYQAAQAQLKALQAQSEAAQAQSHFFTISAPYAGVVSEVPATVGDMVMPGRPLVVLYDPAAMRITAAIPAKSSGLTQAGATVQFEIPDLATGLLNASTVKLLPAVDPAAHTSQLRVSLPDSVKNATPGTFARVWLPASAASPSATERMYVPASAIVRRAEMTGIYVVNEAGHPVLRQVRLGQSQGERIEVLSGIEKGEKIATDPQAAAKVR